MSTSLKKSLKRKRTEQPNQENEILLTSYCWESNVKDPALFRVDLPKNPILPNKTDNLFPLINFNNNPLSPSIPILVKYVGDNDEGIAYNIGLGITMKAIYEDYAQRLDCSSSQLNIYYKGGLVHSWHTPFAIGLTGNDVLYVISENGVMNLNTHVKVFSIEEMKTTPKMLYYKADKLLKCVYMFHEWAAAFDVDPSRVYLICNNTVVNESMTIEEMKIKNGDRVLAFIEGK